MACAGFKNCFRLDRNGSISRHFLAGSSNSHFGSNISSRFWHHKSFWSKKNRYAAGPDGFCLIDNFDNIHQ